MSHYLVRAPVLPLPSGVIPTACEAQLVAAGGESNGFVAGEPGAVGRAVDVAAVTAAADLDGAVAARAQEAAEGVGSSRGRSQAIRQSREWTGAAIPRILSADLESRAESRELAGCTGLRGFFSRRSIYRVGRRGTRS